MPPKAPYPYFGGKSRVAAIIWDRLGNVPNFVSPFCGSLGVELARPHAPGIETVNDIDGLLVNAWRAIRAEPEAVAEVADWPVFELDLHARHDWLNNRKGDLAQALLHDPEFYDVRTGGWWVWGMSTWIAGGFCGKHAGHRCIPHLSGKGQGINRYPDLAAKVEALQALAERLRTMRICCGDWRRVLSPSVTTHHGLTGVLLDPPYATGDNRVYQGAGRRDVYAATVAWAIEHGDDPSLRIALCGYAGDEPMPDSWEMVAWKAPGGHANRGAARDNTNMHRERIWFSPHCLTSSTEPARPHTMAFDLETA